MTDKLALNEDKGVKRYNLVLPFELWLRLQSAAKNQDLTVAQVIRKLVREGLDGND
jgi:hypothetical protein